MNLIQALYLHNEPVVREQMRKGRHPGRFIEHCVTARHRPDLLEFLLTFMSIGDVNDLRCILRVKRHLEFIDRYPRALDQINCWLDQQNQSA